MEYLHALLLTFLELTFIFVGLALLYSQRRAIGKAPFFMSLGLLLLFSHFIGAADLRVTLIGTLDFQVGNTIIFLPILAALDRFNAAGYPVLIGASRKRFVGSLLAGVGVTEPDMASKDNATAAISALCAEHGVWAVRVHDVAKSRDAVAVGNAWREYANA